MAPPEITALHDQVSRAFLDWRDDVYRYLLTLGLSPPEAQDATQEVFFRLYVALRKGGEEIRNQRGWVFRVAHNLGLTLSVQQSSTLPLDAHLELTLKDHKRSTEIGLIEREKLERMHGALRELSPQQRQCLHMRADGLRYQEIADTLGVSISTVSEFLRRALARLRKAVYE